MGTYCVQVGGLASRQEEEVCLRNTVITVVLRGSLNSCRTPTRIYIFTCFSSSCLYIIQTWRAFARQGFLKCLDLLSLFISSSNGGTLYNELKHREKIASRARCWQPPATIDALLSPSVFGTSGSAFHSNTPFPVSWQTRDQTSTSITTLALPWSLKPDDGG